MTLPTSQQGRKAVRLTPETIKATRQWFADNALACIAEAESGSVFVNDPKSHREWCMQRHADALAGRSDHTLTFLQRAHWIQTGEMVPLLP